jgi:hypothetical protein
MGNPALRCLVDYAMSIVTSRADQNLQEKPSMNAPLPFVLTSSFADVGTNVAGVCAGTMAPLCLRDRPGNGKHPAFVERRRPDTGTSDNEVRSPAVLGFVGLVWGLVVSAVLTLGVSAGLALAGVSWMAAGHYCAAIILLVFGLVGIVLYRGTRGEHPFMAGIQRYMEAAVERRHQYLYLSSINALENARRLGLWERHIEGPRGIKGGRFQDVPLGVTVASINRFAPGPHLDFAPYSGTSPSYAAAASG